MTTPFDKRREMVLDESVRIAKGVLDAVAENKPRVTEHEFVNHYLPILTARNLRNENGDIVPVDMNHWFAVSGNAFNAVDVVDENGVVLFEVPPVNRTGDVKFRTKGNLSFQAAADLYPRIMEMNPRNSDDYLINEYFTRNGHVDIKPDVMAWVEILKRYDLLHTLTGAPAPTATQNQQTSTDSFNSDSTEYDDF